MWWFSYREGVMSADRVAEVNAFIRLGGKPVLWKGAVFRCRDGVGNISMPFVVTMGCDRGCLYRECFFGKLIEDVDSFAGQFQFDAGDYSYGKTIVVDAIPPDALPVGEWGVLDG
jgi:hypothetical protein